MALDLSTKNKQLTALDAAIWVGREIKNRGVVPKESDLQRVYPKVLLNDVLFLISNVGGVPFSPPTQLVQKIDQVLAKLETLKQTIEGHPEGYGSFDAKSIPQQVLANPQFLGLSTQDARNELEAARLKMMEAQYEAFWLGREEATLLGAVIQDEDSLKELWGRTVVPPTIATAAGAFAFTNPAMAIFALPAIAFGAKPYFKIKSTLKNFQTRSLYFTAPAQVLEFKYKQAWKKAAFAIPKALLFRTRYFTTPFGKSYPYKDFWPTEVLGKGTSGLVGGLTSGAEWVHKKVFKGSPTVWKEISGKVSENLKPFYWHSKEGPKKRDRRGPWGVVVAVVAADIVGTLAGKIIENLGRKVLGQARWVRLTKTFGTTGFVTRNVAGGVFSLNTGAGFLLGNAIGGPVVGGVLATLGAGYNITKNFSETTFTKIHFAGKDYLDSSLLMKERQEVFTGQKILTRWERFLLRVGKPAELLAQEKVLGKIKPASVLLNRVPLKGFALGFLISGGNPIVALQVAGVQFIWASRSPVATSLIGGVNAFVEGLSGGKYPNLKTFIEKGPRWARTFKGGRVLGGAGVGGALGYFAGGPLGALAGVVVGGASYFALTKSGYLASKYIPQGLKTLWGKLPPWKSYWKGTGGGFVFAGFLAGLGVPVWAALPLGIGIGIGTQWAWKRFVGQALAKGAAKFAVTRVAVRAIPVAGWVLLGLDLVRLIFPYAAELLDRFIIQQIEKLPRWLRFTLLWPVYANLKLLYWLLKGIGWVIDKILWPVDKLLDLAFSYIIVPIFGPILQGLYKLGAFALGWTQNLPGFLGGWARGVGGFFKGVFGGAAQAVVSAILGLLGAIISLLTGGDIAEAAVIGAIGLVMAGAVLNSQTIESAFFQPLEAPELGAPVSPYLRVEKSVSPQGQVSSLPQDLIFTVVVTALQQQITELKVTDSLTVRTGSGSFNPTKDSAGRPISPIPCPSTLEAGQNCSYSFTITATAPSYGDSLVINQATTEGSVSIGPGIPSKQTSSASVSVIIGNPPIDTPNGWPTNGNITQGPNGPPSSHAGEAIDIAGGLGVPVYSTFNAKVTLFNNGDCGLGIELAPEDNSFHVSYCHLNDRTVNSGDRVTWGQLIGHQGHSGDVEPRGPAGTHLHYAFRGLDMAEPLVPVTVPNGCSKGISDCGIRIDAAPCTSSSPPCTNRTNQ